MVAASAAAAAAAGELAASSRTALKKAPRRFLFIASIGNLPAPYTLTRHSAGHTLLTHVEPLLRERAGYVHPMLPSLPVFYKTWKCPALMNVSGPPLQRQLRPWLKDHELRVRQLGVVGRETPRILNLWESSIPGQHVGESVELYADELSDFRSTLVILHDELEAPTGKVKVKRGGPEEASLRGHRGLISVMESLRGAGLRNESKAKPKPSTSDLAILRVGIGIGRPSSRHKSTVADYVLTKMSPHEMNLVEAAAAPVVDILIEEMYRE
jgi:PTH1 family peptidyl-tRNA hydrolase